LHAQIREDIPITESYPIRTPTYEQVKHAISAGNSPLLLSGLPGSGKTTILSLISHDWTTQNKPVLFIPLYKVFQEADFFALLQASMSDASLGSTFDEPSVLMSSGRQALEATLQRVRSLPDDTLLLLDGLDETRNSALVLRLVRLLSESSRVLIVVSTREAFEPTPPAGLFKLRITIPPLTADQVIQMWVSRFSSVGINPSLVAKIIEFSQGSPLVVRLLLEAVSERGEDSLANIDAISIDATPVKGFVLNTLTAVTVDGMRVLSVLAILNRPLANSDILGLGVNDLDHLIFRFLLRKNGTVSLAHPMLAEPILAKSGLLPGQGAYLHALQFGAEEAERDNLLTKGFIKPPGFTELLLGTKNIVIGDRGTGKSAMFAQLSAEPQRTSKDDVNHNVIAVTHPADMLNRLETNGRNFELRINFVRVG
jgi:GTPase SAR1 family protein